MDRVKHKVLKRSATIVDPVWLVEVFYMCALTKLKYSHLELGGFKTYINNMTYPVFYRKATFLKILILMYKSLIA